MSAVVIADVKTGQVSDFVVVDTPIGLYHAKGALPSHTLQHSSSNISHDTPSHTFPPTHPLTYRYPQTHLLYQRARKRIVSHVLSTLQELNLTFVSCKSKDRGGIVYGINVNTLIIEKQYTHKHVVHPTGITSYAGILYIAEQKLGAILTFDIAKETYLGPIVTEGVKDIEQIALSPC